MATSLAEDPARAYQYAEAARQLAARVGIVRETCAIAAYQAGNWAAALAEFRAARRLTGRASYLPLMADCERALGRPDRALDIVTGPEARAADRPTQIELKIVESGIRRDQGLPEAAVVALQMPELNDRRGRPAPARLLYAYADALLDAGREEDAREWFARAAAADPEGETDAADRMDELDDFILDDLEFDEDSEPASFDEDSEPASAAESDVGDAEPNAEVAAAGAEVAEPNAAMTAAAAAETEVPDSQLAAAEAEAGEPDGINSGADLQPGADPRPESSAAAAARADHDPEEMRRQNADPPA